MHFSDVVLIVLKITLTKPRQENTVGGPVEETKKCQPKWKPYFR